MPHRPPGPHNRPHACGTKAPEPPARSPVQQSHRRLLAEAGARGIRQPGRLQPPSPRTNTHGPRLAPAHRPEQPVKGRGLQRDRPSAESRKAKAQSQPHWG